MKNCDVKKDSLKNQNNELRSKFFAETFTSGDEKTSLPVKNSKMPEVVGTKSLAVNETSSKTKAEPLQKSATMTEKIGNLKNTGK